MVDQKDLTIIEILEKNARTPFTEIAKVLNISEAAIRKRVKKLEDENIILNYKASINYRKLGYSNKIIMGVDTTPEKYLKVIKELKNLDFVKDLNTSSGDHMIMFEVWVKNINQLEEYLEIINNLDGVIESCPSIIHENIKS
jgi:Lrp/AsnC family transcriptional regulator for asnA, asnC and gidA